ncbi:B12-binding domain-containing radical SAM protein [Kitasatospora sp. NPDC058184]|uniref:B12-binding domain-containing radical SAM protein n=1 Tax=Kitasatospora sp. NPDC058184 TaxID=3346370 RepID=UPI0036DF1810
MTTRVERTTRPQIDRLREALQLAAPEAPTVSATETDRLLVNPVELRDHLTQHLGDHASRVLVAGTLDRRLVLIEQPDARWVVADLSGHNHDTRYWPTWITGHIEMDTPDSWLSLANLDDAAVHRFTKPTVLLAALYHPEHFPLPRFPLGVSDVARAARSTLTGEVSLLDMQLGTTLSGLIMAVAENRPDILGISATFGQHDLMTELLDAAYSLESQPMVIAGGSLTARNEALLLERYPKLLVARGAGEPTIKDLLAHWHGDIPLNKVHGIGYNGAARGEGTLIISRRRTAKPVSNSQDDIFPELDLLPATFEHKGVAQAEGSRGCTNYCSFCPRGHKGTWFGSHPEAFPWLLEEMGHIFDRYPHVSRTLYLVDEEFIGRDDGAVPRALNMGSTLHDAGFTWETSCRVDQVVRLDQDTAWHRERADMWRRLVQHGLRRCLFGVESGVDSILERFNKETTGEQIAVAIRTLSALGVPTRFTYISFDQLMTFEELKATYAYQGRTDLLLRPMPNLPIREIVEGVQDPEWVAWASSGRPLHSGISYMLVSMECLVGAAYTKRAQAAGLTGEVRPSMGRVDSRFADWRIGVASQWAQLWVDRNFALDYTFKSLEKMLDGDPRSIVRAARIVLKYAAYQVFGRMIDAIEQTPPVPGEKGAEAALGARVRTELEDEFKALSKKMAGGVEHVLRNIPKDFAAILDKEYLRWEQTSEWRSINASDPCGT